MTADMKFSDQLEKRFAEMVTHYPTKRSVLVPMLLYVQDEVGYLSDEVIAEIGQRLELTDLEVRNVISYYSMLRTKPVGKYNVQVCTNISCMLRGGEEILEHCKKKLGIGHKQTTRRRNVFAGRSGMHRRLQLGTGDAGELRLSREPDDREDGRGFRRYQEEGTAVTLCNLLFAIRFAKRVKTELQIETANTE